LRYSFLRTDGIERLPKEAQSGRFRISAPKQPTQDALDLILIRMAARNHLADTDQNNAMLWQFARTHTIPDKARQNRAIALPEPSGSAFSQQSCNISSL